MNDRQQSVVHAFRQLHEAGCFVIPNPWDIGSARFLESLGFKALATTSAGFAFTRGLPDDPRAVARDLMLAHVGEIAAATALPVNADFQSAYADDPADVAANVALCAATGVAGLSVEDASGNPAHPLHEQPLAVERVRAARRAIDDAASGVLLTARSEAWLVGHPDPFRTAIDRLVAFADAGADCLFAPGVADEGEIAAIVRAVAPKPVNVLVSRPGPAFTVERLRDLGVRRISVGSALARTAWGGFIRAASEIAERGSFDAFQEAASFAELNRLFVTRR